MSSVIFDSHPGRLVAVPSNGPRAMRMRLGNFEGTGVVTGLNVEQGVAAQFQPSLDGAVYVTPFGDKMGTMQVSLLLNEMALCGSGAARGFDAFMAAYSRNRLSPSNAAPLELIVGASMFIGFAVGFQINGASDNGHVIRGTLQFAAWLVNGE